MEIVNANDENSFDPTPRLKSSPIPIKFISFNVLDENCIYCGEKYIKALFCFWQKYCKKCLSRYINDITENDIYLDVHYTMDLECSEHEISRTKIPQSIQECCGNCLAEFENIVKKINEYFVPYDILEFIIKEKKQPKQNNKWIPYCQFKDVKEMTKGGYGIIYKATWSNSNYISELENNKDIESLSLQNLNSNYISEELELDIDIESLSSQNLSSTIQNLDSRYISAELELDINTESFKSQNLSSTIQKFSTFLKKRRNEEFLNVEPHDNSGKRIKTNLKYP
ncbi:hypothetical protein RhiirA1_493363 [Rhizophagus irregularis]|uniref:Protein kinase domain-containing protein n=1 Tax=Rhizophagus irregularis TaxID=588596 RepID=A0A2N0S9A7_9GLOM|nr:hypothetical protein RhiirA1_493363 [Rhizophagus irregularis]